MATLAGGSSQAAAPTQGVPDDDDDGEVGSSQASTIVVPADAWRAYMDAPSDLEFETGDGSGQQDS